MTQQSRWFRSRVLGFIGGAGLTLALLGASLTPAASPAVGANFAVPGTASFADVAEQVSPAVVNIAVTKLTQPTSGFSGGPGQRGRSPLDELPLDEFFGRFGVPGVPFPPQPPRRLEGQGSGFLIDPEGYIVTNQHVVGAAEKIVVTLQDGRKLDAVLVGEDEKTDLAALKVDGEDLPHVRFGDSDRARVGDWVLAIGNPFGLGGTATAGIISARGRDIQSGPYDDYLQIDAPINSGNSGGPVFNAAGEVIGVNTAIFSPNGGNIGIGFAIPANQAAAVVAELKAHGTVERGWLGVQIQDLDEDLAASLGLESADGALVADILGDGPAKRAGLQPGDVITHFGDRVIDSAKALSRAVGDSNPGEDLSVSVWRDGREHELAVTLGRADRSERVAANAPEAGAADELGLVLEPLTEAHRARLGIAPEVQGALIVRVDPSSPAAQKGLRPGDVITQVNQKEVDSVAAVADALADAKAKRSRALILVRRGDAQRFVSLGFA